MNRSTLLKLILFGAGLIIVGCAQQHRRIIIRYEHPGHWVPGSGDYGDGKAWESYKHFRPNLEDLNTI